MTNIAKRIKEFFEGNDWEYDFVEKNNVFISGIDMGNVIGKIKLFVFIEKDFYTVYTCINGKVEEKYYQDVAEFLHRANYGTRNGNFEMDYRDGEIRYKVFVETGESEVSEDIIRNSIFTGPSMINGYGKGLYQLMLGAGTPKECIDQCEQDL